MTSDKKWREFWIEAHQKEFELEVVPYLTTKVWDKEPKRYGQALIEVIEKSSLTEANAKIERLEKDLSFIRSLYENLQETHREMESLRWNEKKSQKQIIDTLKGALNKAHLVTCNDMQLGNSCFICDAIEQVEEMEKK